MKGHLHKIREAIEQQQRNKINRVKLNFTSASHDSVAIEFSHILYTQQKYMSINA